MRITIYRFWCVAADIHGDDFNDSHAHFLDSVKVIECTDQQLESGVYRLVDVDLDVQAYQLRLPELESSQQADHSNERNHEDTPQARIVPLPNKELDGVWESYALHSTLEDVG